MIDKKAIDLEALTAFKKGLDSAYFNRIDDILDGTTPPQKVEGQYVSLENGEYNLTVGVTGAAPAQGSVISQINGNDLADSAFHEYINTVGAVIFSFNDSFSPSALWGGSWEKIIDRFLVGAGGDYALESSGGNLLHNHGEALSIAADQAVVKVKTAQIGAYVSWGFTGTDFKYGQDNVSINGAYQLVTDDASVMPPYVSCNIWRKIA